MSGKIIDNQGGRNPSNNGGGGNTTSQILIDAIRSLISIFSGSIKVKIPENIVNPEGSKTVDVYRLQTIGSGLTETIIEIIASKSETFRFIRYGFFNNKALGIEVEFFPTIDGVRILELHGDPMLDYKLYLALGTDLAESNLIFCDITLLPGQKLEWKAKNNGGAMGEFGVRMRGYKVNTNNGQKSG
jgi:hypothetical protein